MNVFCLLTCAGEEFSIRCEDFGTGKQLISTTAQSSEAFLYFQRAASLVRRFPAWNVRFTSPIDRGGSAL